MSMKFITNIMLFLFDFKKPIHYDRWNKWNTPVGNEGETKRKSPALLCQVFSFVGVAKLPMP